MMAYSVEVFQCHLPPQLQINMISILILQMNRKVFCDCRLLFFFVVVVVVVVVAVVHLKFCCCSSVNEEAFFRWRTAKLTDTEQQQQTITTITTTTTTRAIYIHTVLFFSIFQNSYPLNNSTQSPALQCMTYLSSGWTSNEKKNWNHNTLQLSTSLGH